MLFAGFDVLITAALTPLGSSHPAAHPGLAAGTDVPGGFPDCWYSGRNGSASNRARTYREVRRARALVIMQFIETMAGIKALQAYRQ